MSTPSDMYKEAERILNEKENVRNAAGIILNRLLKEKVPIPELQPYLNFLAKAKALKFADPEVRHMFHQILNGIMGLLLTQVVKERL